MHAMERAMERSKSESLPPRKMKTLPAISATKKKVKVSQKSTKLKKSKKSVQELLVQSMGSMIMSDTITVSTDKIETVLKYERLREHDNYNHKRHESYDLNSREELNTFSLTSPGKARNGENVGDLSSVHSRSVYSSWEDASLSSTTSRRSNYTSHELIAQINNRAIHNQPPPDFVPSLRALPFSSLSWNNRLPVNHNPDNPPINIVPCLIPLEVILAKADRRIRKREKATKERNKQNETRLEQLEQSLEAKRTRAERFAAKLALQQLQCAWFRTVIVARYIAQLKPQFDASMRLQSNWFKVVNSARVVQKFFLRWYNSEVKSRMQRRYIAAFARVEGALKIRVRIFRKCLAVQKIKSFIAEFKGQHMIPMVVHRFLLAVRKIQRNIRDFIACKHGKIIVLGKIWDKIEHTYIRKKLEQRKAKIAGATLSKKTLDKALNDMRSVAFEEIRDKEKEWHKIHSQMEKIVKGLRATGIIKDETIEDTIHKLKVSHSLQVEMLSSALEKMRKTFYTDQKAQIRKKVEQDSCFNEAHAANLLLGDGNEVMRLFREKLNKKLVNLKYKPFMLFSSLDKRLIFEKIKEAHSIQGTFKIKLDDSLNI